MRDWIDVVKEMFGEADQPDLFGNNDNLPKSLKKTSQHNVILDTSQLDEFTRSYINAALWTSYDDNEEALDANYDMDDISPDTLKSMIEDCMKFQREGKKLIYMAGKKDPHYTPSDAGYDFWLTRNGHGAGFQDRDLDQIGDKLRILSKNFGEVDLYVEDGVIY